MHAEDITVANSVAANRSLRLMEQEDAGYKLSMLDEHDPAIAQTSEHSRRLFVVSSAGVSPFSARLVVSDAAITKASATLSGAIKASVQVVGVLTAFGERDTLRQSELKRIVQSVRASSVQTYGLKLANRLETLIEAYADENRGRLLSADSLRDLIRFLEINSTFRYPTVTVTPAGNLYAQWKRGDDKLLSIHFLPTGDARFVIFKPNPQHAGRIVRISGSATADVLADAVMPYGVQEWAQA